MILLLCLILLIQADTALAGNITFIKKYTYQASDIDSKVSSRAIALEQVKRALLEELGTYLMSETEVKNYQLTKDQVTTLTAGIVRAEIVDEKWDGRTYYLKARITADPKEVAKSVEALKNDKAKSAELEESRKRTLAAMEEVVRLRNELDLIKSKENQSNYSTQGNELRSGNSPQQDAMADLPSAHAAAIRAILKNTRTDEDVAREEAERKRKEEEAEKEGNSVWRWLLNLFPL